MKKFIAVIATVLFLNIFAQPVFADTKCETTTSSYGQTSTDCKETTATTQVTQVTTVAAGLGDVSFWVIAQILTIVSVVLFGAAKVAERTYWFD